MTTMIARLPPPAPVIVSVKAGTKAADDPEQAVAQEGQDAAARERAGGDARAKEEGDDLFPTSPRSGWPWWPG
jgi:hypothetical protein